MSAEGGGGAAMAPQDAADIKQCCARLYESDLARRLLGESFHPGGTALTARLGTLLNLSADSVVLDVASGAGTSALFLAERFGCRVVGVDLGAANVARAGEDAVRLGLAERVRFETGDAERLPLDAGSIDAVICECAFCTFPDKSKAAAEFARVLKAGGRVGLSDVTRSSGPPGELSDLMAWVTCLADAQPAASYVEWLTGAGFGEPLVEPHDEALQDLIRGIGSRLFATEVLVGLGKLQLDGIDFAAARRLTKEAMAAVAQRRLGYAIVCARKTG